VYHYGQHATATCCRRCFEYWHGVPLERPLDSEHLEYATALVWRYIEERLSNS
jgi:hypothetical protein